MTDHLTLNEITFVIDALPVNARPYLLALLLNEDAMHPALSQHLTHHLADVADLIDEQHLALVAVHEYGKRGQTEAAAREWGAITYAGTADEARAAARFMASLPSVIRLIQATLSGPRH